MAHQNAEVLLGFLHSEFGFDYASMEWNSIMLSSSSAQIELAGKDPAKRISLVGAILEDPPFDEHLHSGELSPSINKLDADLQNLRLSYPSLPLAVLFYPELYRSRIHTWMVGEYTAERKLPVWADLRHLHPGRQCDWVRNLTECGLISPACVLVVGPGLRREDFPCLQATGSWLIEADSVSSWMISQQV